MRNQTVVGDFFRGPRLKSIQMIPTIRLCTGGGSRLSCVLENGSYIYSVSLSAYGCVGYMGLEEPSDFIEIDVYPNPSAGIFNIKYVNEFETPTKLQISDSKGKLILELNSRKEIEQIDLSHQPAGVSFKG